MIITFDSHQRVMKRFYHVLTDDKHRLFFPFEPAYLLQLLIRREKTTLRLFHISEPIFSPFYFVVVVVVVVVLLFVISSITRFARLANFECRIESFSSIIGRP